MIDLRGLREDPGRYRAALARKGFPQEELERVLECDGSVRGLKAEIEALRASRNLASKEIPQATGDRKEALLAEMKQLAAHLKEREPALRQAQQDLDRVLARVPNPPDPSAPEGAGEDANVVRRTVGAPPKFSFPARDHVELGELRDWIDIPRAARSSGTRFAYLKGELVELEMALIGFAFEILKRKGFRPVVPPIVVREAAMYGTGFFPADRNEIYKLEGEDAYLIGTSEVPLAALHMEETIDGDSLPRRYAGFSTCLRREAGSYGKDTRGIFRVHQFDKVEMFSFCAPGSSPQEHLFLLSVEEEILAALEIPYRVVDVCASDLGSSAARKYDLEAWLPGQQAYREVTSCSNCTDFQARRLGARGRFSAGPRLLHTLNGTAIAVGRTLIALLENHQEKNGSVRIPAALRPQLGGRDRL